MAVGEGGPELMAESESRDEGHPGPGNIISPRSGLEPAPSGA